MPIDCDECRGLGDDYRFEDGELVSNCDGCVNNDAQREYEAAIDMLEFCEKYEQAYNSEDGSM